MRKGNHEPSPVFKRPQITPRATDRLRSPLGIHQETQDIDDPQPRNQQSTYDDSHADRMRKET